MDTTITVQDNWIMILENGTFVCIECENESHPQTNTVDGIVDANLEEIKADLEQFPTKVIYGICSVCGMEYIFKLADGQLYLEPSEEEK